MNERPHILLIMTDQQQAGLMSHAGNRWLRTPAMDRLAAEGVRFERAYACNPVCLPSRMSIATGMMPGRLGVFVNSDRPAIPEAIARRSLGWLMREADYDTGYFGKTHLCPEIEPAVAGYAAVDPDDRDGLPDAFRAFLRRPRHRPFFAVTSLLNPHDICFAHSAKVRDHRPRLTHVDELYRHASRLPLCELPPLPDNHEPPRDECPGIEACLSPKPITPAITMRRTYDERDWRIYRWIYHRLTELADAQVGRLLAALDDADAADRTLVVFCSDHGDMDAQHRLASKSMFADASARVPLIVRDPLQCGGAVSSRGGRVDAESLVSLGLDLLPTFCDYAGIAPPALALGRSLRPLVEGRSALQPAREYVACETRFGRMIRSVRYKYCVYDRPVRCESLADLRDDPGESVNLAGNPAHAPVIVEHRRLLAQWVEVSNDRQGAAMALGQAAPADEADRADG